MKKQYILGVMALALSTTSNAQFSDDFEGYVLGDYIGANNPSWTTWSGATGGAEDVQVTAADANAGNNSIYFSGTGDGGPQDVVLDFGSEMNVGQFDFYSYFKVETGKGAYFNFQANSTIGQVWALDVHMVDNGNLVLSNGDGIYITTSYPTNTWFKLGLNLDLTTNNWVLLIDDVEQGAFANTQNQIATMDIFPVNSNNGGNGTAGFYVDDVNYTYTPYTLLAENGAPISITNITGLVGQEKNPTVTIRNLGTTVITSFDLTIDYNGTQITENITGVNIASLATSEVDFTSSIALIAGTNNVTATISNVNGTASDDDASDDIKNVSVNPLVPAPGKIVISEEGTGTWCGWCPRGAVMLDNMSDNYHGFFVGLAVHNDDPMTYAPYDSGLNFTGFPSSRTDRGADVNPSQIESIFLDRVQIAPKAVLTNGVEIVGNQLKVSVSAEFVSGITGDYRLAAVISEDGVTGTGNGWAQSNYYAGGANGEMGGYESLPGTVPADQMVYDHVARVILPGIDGLASSFPATVASGETKVVNFYFDNNPEWDLTKINIVSMLIAPDGSIDNAGYAPMADATTNGFIESAVIFDGSTGLGIETNTNDNTMQIAPNPTSNLTFVSLDNEIAQNVSLTIYDMRGKLINSKNYGEISNNVKLPINTTNFETGIYLITLTVGNTTTTQKLIVK